MSRFQGQAVGRSRLTGLVESGLWPEEDTGITLSFLPCFKTDTRLPRATNGLFRYAIFLCLGFSNPSVTSGFRLEGVYLETSSRRVLVWMITNLGVISSHRRSRIKRNCRSSASSFSVFKQRGVQHDSVRG